MNKSLPPILRFDNPPINEIVCGVFFDSIKSLHAAHFGVLWGKFKPDFPTAEDHNLVNPVPREDFEAPDRLPLPRVWFVHEDKNEIIQVQRNRFLSNWRKVEEDDEYPGYEKVITNFEERLSTFREFLLQEQLGDISVKICELTYIDHILEGEGWETLNSLRNLFPELFPLSDWEALSLRIEGINWETSFVLPDSLGHLQLSIRSGQRISDKRPLLSVQFNARSNEAHEPMRNWFDSAHDYITRLFSELVNVEVQERFWRKKNGK